MPPNSGKEKLQFKSEETLSRNRLIRGGRSCQRPVSKERKEEGERTERMEERERRSTAILAIFYRTKYINSNYPLAGELVIVCTFIMIDTCTTRQTEG